MYKTAMELHLEGLVGKKVSIVFNGTRVDGRLKSVGHGLITVKTRWARQGSAIMIERSRPDMIIRIQSIDAIWAH